MVRTASSTRHEEEAYTQMRRQAMSRQQKLIQVAEQIIATSEMLN